MNDTAVARKRSLTHEQQNAAAGACERGGEEGTDATRAEHGVSKHGATLAAAGGGCADRAGEVPGRRRLWSARHDRVDREAGRGPRARTDRERVPTGGEVAALE